MKDDFIKVHRRAFEKIVEDSIEVRNSLRIRVLAFSKILRDQIKLKWDPSDFSSEKVRGD